MTMRQDSEPSVEDILASIKKVIARDNRETAREARRQRELDAPEGSDPPDADSAGIDTRDDEDILDLQNAAHADTVELDTAGDMDGHMDDDDGPSLISGRAHRAMRDNLAALAMLAEPGASPQIVRAGETSLEELVRQMLRPMLADWLDTNLPGMVEDMVRKEIERIAGKRG